MCCCVHGVREKRRDAAPVRVGIHAHPPVSWPAGAAARRAWVGDSANCPRGRVRPPAGIGTSGIYLGISGDAARAPVPAGTGARDCAMRAGPTRSSTPDWTACAICA
ncbi:hypothetical protein L493_1020 [Bordetella bronchiseptica 99-R-0433]|nr:hypothetical protein L493_1020 [Bordetella bronchiseptica 99-R-0433]